VRPSKCGVASIEKAGMRAPFFATLKAASASASNSATSSRTDKDSTSSSSPGASG